MNLRKIRNLAIVLALILLAGGIGYDIGRKKIAVTWSQYKPYVTIENKTPPPGRDIDFALFWEVWSRLEKDYIDREDLDPQNMVWGGIKGMVASLDDPYTVFLPPEENQRAKEDLAGSFEGIGAQLGMKNKRIIVVAPLKGMPAEEAGLKAGDFIVEVDGQDTSNWTLPEAVNNIRGPKDTQVMLTIFREGESDTLEIAITRGTIQVPSIEIEVGSVQCEDFGELSRARGSSCQIVEAEECEQCAKAAILRLYRFGDRTNGEWEDSVSKIAAFQAEVEAQGDKFAGMIFDLRNNPGGYLQGAVYVTSEFLDSGVVVQQRMKDGTTETFTVNRDGRLTKVPMVVLVNSGSASASEIVAGALQDHGRAKLVGTKTFGKGSVQTAQELSHGAGLHVTTAKWLLPEGGSIDENGIEPDIIVENGVEDPTQDLQLERAIEELLNL